MTDRKERIPNCLRFDKNSGRYRFTHPITRKRSWFGKDRDVAIARAKAAVAAIKAIDSIRSQIPSEMVCLTDVIAKYVIDVVPYKPWADSTRGIKLGQLRLYQREFGRRPIRSIDRKFLADWMRNRPGKADAYNEHRAILSDVWAYAISENMADSNEAEKTLKRSTSKKIKANQRDRLPLNLADFWIVHKASPLFLQVAMELSLVTLQARTEIVSFEDSNYRDGWMYFIRQKTHTESDMAFLRIKVTEQIKAIRTKAFSGNLLCPYWVNTRPIRQSSRHRQNKPHPFSVTPDHLTKTFKRIRDSTGLFDNLDMNQRPTFHCIRGLGGRIYEELGYSRKYVQSLMAHSDPKVTEIYLEDPTRIVDSDFKKVEAGLSFKDLSDIVV